MTEGATDRRIEQMVEAATQHGMESANDHEIGDLQMMLVLAWSLMDGKQRNELFTHEDVQEVLAWL